jgi:hypothetical protein
MRASRLSWLAASLVAACADAPPTAVVDAARPDGADAAPIDDRADVTPVDDRADAPPAVDRAPIDDVFVPDTPAPEDSVACTPNPTLVASRRRCLADDACPCGTHCELGECVPRCGAGMPDCGAGQRCDSFGRCRAMGEVELAPPAAPVREGRVQFDRTTVTLGASGGGTSIILRARDGAVSAARVVAPPNFEVACDGTTYGQECRLTAMMPNVDQRVALRPVAGAMVPPAESTEVKVFYGGTVDAVSILPPATATPPMQPVEGTYTGTATLEGSFATPTGAVTPAPFRASVPVTANAFSAANFDLVDPLRALTGAPHLSVTGATAALYPYLTLNPATGASFAVVARVTTTVQQYDGALGSLVLRVLVQPIHQSRTASGTRWRVDLRRTGALPMGAARLPSTTVATAPDPAAVAAARFPIETALEAGFPSVEGRTADDRAAVARSYREDPATPERRLDACVLAQQTDAWWAGRSAAVWPEWRVTSPTPVSGPTLATRDPVGLGAALLEARPLATTTTFTAFSVRPEAPDWGLASRPTDIPCAVNIYPTADACLRPTGGESVLVDVCDRVAADYNCTPILLNNERQYVVGSVTRGGSTCSFRLETAVRRVCRRAAPDSALHARCAEWTSCYAGTPTARNASQAFAAVPTASVSGDLACGAISAAIRADGRRDAVGSTVNTNELLRACVAELGRVRAPLPTATPGDLYATMNALSNAGGGAPSCIDASRHLLALLYAAQSVRIDGNARGARYAHRLAQQWLQLHALLATEGANQRAIDPAVRGISAPADPFGTDAVALETTLRGWELLLHPRVADVLYNTAGAVIEQPDYRAGRGFTLPALGSHLQNVGLPVAAYETLRAQMTLLGVALDRAARTNDRALLTASGAADPLMGRALRSAFAALPLVQKLSADAQASARSRMATVAWRDRETRAATLVDEQLREVVSTAQNILAGRNPLGIEDEDLPLYFRGAPTSADGRFAAVSNYLVGTTPLDSGWAEATLGQARTAEAGLAEAYRAQALRQYQQALTGAALATRLDEIRRNYGTQVANLCGTPDAITDTRDVLERWEAASGRPFNANTCFRTNGPSCGADSGALNARVELDDIRMALCTLRDINGRTANAITTPDVALSAIVTTATPDLATCTSIAPCPAGGSVDERCLRCGATLVRISLDTLRVLTQFPFIDAGSVRQARARCRGIYPSAREQIPMPSDLDVNPQDIAACYRVRGSLGETEMAVAQAQTDILSARSDYAARQEGYDIAVRSCFLQLEGDMALAGLQAEHDANMRELRAGRLVADGIAYGAAAVKDCCAITASEEVIDVIATGGGLAATAIGGCAAAAVEAVALVASGAVENRMATVEANHNREVMRLASNTGFRVCMNNAAMELVGARSAALRVQRSMQDLNVAVYRLAQGVASAQGAYDEGRAVLAETQARAVAPPELDAWVDARTTEYRRTFRRARRFAYLAVRASEYEYQLSMSARAAVLSASSVADLDRALESVRLAARSGRIGGNPPADGRALVSLREHLLQVGSRAVANPNELRLTAAERFRLHLQNPRFAVYGPTGAWLGQRIPFSMAPLRGLGVGEPGDVPIYSSRSCAERIWSVNASVEGDAATLYRGSVAEFTAIDLEKRNTFYSNWCVAPAAGGERFQQASVRPAVNLFRDPEAGAPGAAGMDVGGAQNVSAGINSLSVARMQPRLNVPRAAFAMDDFGSGSSSELAGRGLYGAYNLFIPAEAISRRRPDGSYTSGLNLDAVDDILLRVDYVSVARSGP